MMNIRIYMIIDALIIVSLYIKILLNVSENNRLFNKE